MRFDELQPWILPILLFLFPIIFFVKKLIRSSKTNLPPGPPRLPIIGNLHQIGPLPHRGLWNLAKKYGDVLTVGLGGVTTVVVHSPETAQEVLKIHDSECCTRPRLSISDIFFYNSLDVAFTQHGDYHREVRKICALELFSVKRVNSFAYVREEELSLLLDSLSASASAGTAVNVSEMLIKYVANLTCRVAGLSSRGSGIDNDRFLEVFKEANVMLGKFAAADVFPRFGWIIDRITGLYARRVKSFRNLDAFYQQAIDDHLLRSSKTEEGRDDLIQVLLNLQKQDVRLGSSRITNNHIKAILMDIFLAGVDTSSLSMDWALAELVRHPRVLKKVQAEIRDCIGSKGKVTHEDLNQLEYMKMVIKETWRLYVGAILIPREAMSEFQINGYNIYPGTRIHVNVWAIGRNPNVWKDPEEFIPERFIGTNIEPKGSNFELLTFGSGRRSCPAMYMGTTTVEYSLANLLYHFDWKLPEGMKPEDVSMVEAPGLTVTRRDPLELIPVKYQY